MSISRRKFLGWLGAAGLGATLGTPANAASNKEFDGYPDSMGVLFDNTRCIGCRKCEAGCNKVNELPAPDKPFDELSVLEDRRRTDHKTYTVVNRYDRYVGALYLTTLLTEEPSLSVAEVMDKGVAGIPAEMHAGEVATLFETRDLVTAPVVAPDGRLAGRITVDDVVDVIREQADHSIMSMAGLDEEDDMFAPVVRSSRRRAVWLGVNLATAFVASWVVGLFQATINQVQQANDIVELCIADTGPGIPLDETDKVTQRFYRLERSRSTPSSGLGLSLVNAIAHLHSAQLLLEDNTPGLKAILRFETIPCS